MRIAVEFHFNDQTNPAAVTGVMGPVTDLLLPSVGDTVRHCDESGAPFQGLVTHRVFSYELANGSNVDGSVIVTVAMDRLAIH